jgi:transposase-like protein
MGCGICENTLSAWRKQYSDLKPRIDAAREVARQTALQGIKTAGKKGWRALAEWLKLTFPEYRSPRH